MTTSSWGRINQMSSISQEVNARESTNRWISAETTNITFAKHSMNVSPLSNVAALPAESREAASFIRDTPPDAIVGLWGSQLSALEGLVQGCKLAQSKWDACIPNEIPPASGKLQTVAMKKLMRQLGMGCSTWLGQFAYAFPITGQLSQKHLFPAEPPKYERLTKDKIPHSSAARFRGRAAKSGHKNAQPLWGEEIQQVEKGVASPPYSAVS